VLLAFSVFLIETGSGVNGDVMIVLTPNMPLLLYWRYLKDGNDHNGKWFGIVAGIFWVLAFFTKESAVYYLAACGYFTWYSFPNGHIIRFWKYFWVTLLGAGVLTLFYFYFQTGDPFRKITLAQETVRYYDGGSPWKIWNTPIEQFYRFSFQPLVFFAENYSFGLLVIFSVFNFSSQKNQDSAFWFRYLLLIAGMWWFFPQSWQPFHPMWLIYRLWSPLLVPLAISAAYGMKTILDNKETWIAKIVMIAMVSLFIGLSFHHEYVTIYYIITGGFAIVTFWIQENKIIPNLRKMVLVIALLPFFWEHQEQWRWRDSQVSEYKYNIGVINILHQRNAGIVIATQCLSEFHKLYDDSLRFVVYQSGQIPTNLSQTHLIIDKSFLKLKQSKGNPAFGESDTVIHQIEVEPEKLGFVLVQTNERYVIYYHP